MPHSICFPVVRCIICQCIVSVKLQAPSRDRAGNRYLLYTSLCTLTKHVRQTNYSYVCFLRLSGRGCGHHSAGRGGLCTDVCTRWLARYVSRVVTASQGCLTMRSCAPCRTCRSTPQLLSSTERPCFILSACKRNLLCGFGGETASLQCRTTRTRRDLALVMVQKRR